MPSSGMGFRVSVLGTIVLAVLWRHAACAGKDPKGNDLKATYVEPGYTIVDKKVNETGCKVLTVYPNLNREINDMNDRNAKLVTYEITLEGYVGNPLHDSVTRHFHADHWYRSFNNHGRTLLTLSFDYDIVSLWLLSIGVEHMDVALKDEPKGCLGDLDEEVKFAVLLELMTSDFQTEEKAVMAGDEPHVCVEVRTFSP